MKVLLTDFKELFMFSPGTWMNAIIHSIFQHVSLNVGTPVYPGAQPKSLQDSMHQNGKHLYPQSCSPRPYDKGKRA